MNSKGQQVGRGGFANALPIAEFSPESPEGSGFPEVRFFEAQHEEQKVCKSSGVEEMADPFYLDEFLLSETPAAWSNS